VQADTEIQNFLRIGKFDDPTLAAKGNRRADHISWDQFWGLFCDQLAKMTWSMRAAFPHADSVATVDLEGDGEQSSVNPLMDEGEFGNGYKGGSEGMSGPRFSMNPGSSPWVKDHDEQGRAFFFNKLTRESSWTQPKEYDAAFDDGNLGAGAGGGMGGFNSDINLYGDTMKSAI